MTRRWQIDDGRMNARRQLVTRTSARLPVVRSNAVLADLEVLEWPPLPVERLDGTLAVEPPAQIKVSCIQRKGAGPPAWDPDFKPQNCPNCRC